MDALTHLLEPIAAKALGLLHDSASRTFWVYLLSGTLLAWLLHARQGGEGPFAAAFLNRRAWTCRSALNDYAIWVLNPVLLLVFAGVFFANIGGAAAEFGRALFAALPAFGPAEPAGWTSWLLTIGLTLTLFVAVDFMRWWNHYLFHKIPALWEFHKVHHSAEVLNFATADRFHPVELIAGTATMAVALGLVNGLWIALFGNDVAALQLFGANLLWFIANAAGGAIRHAPVWVSYGPVLERWFISPAMHHIHHSAEERHWDRNMGSTLTLWDRMAGTYYRPEGRETFAFGIGEETAEYRTLRALYLLPFIKLVRMASPRRAKAPVQ